MFDGKRSIEEVFKATSGLGVTPDDVTHLVSLGLLAPIDANKDVVAVAAPSFNTAPSFSAATMPAPLGDHQTEAALSLNADGMPTQNAQAHYSRAYPIATRLTAGLGLRGFRLNLAVEGAGNLDKLKEIAPKIREAVGPEKFLELENALYY